jgi:uncharacterized membrane protein YobD (UPF0266 family)
MILQEEIDVALNQMGFFYSSNTTDTNRQMFCQLFDGMSLRKKTKGYKQRIRQARLNLCGASTGKQLSHVLQESLQYVMTDGVIERCLILVMKYKKFLRHQHQDTDVSLPSIAQMLLVLCAIGSRRIIFSEASLHIVDEYIDQITTRIEYTSSNRLASLLAKQPNQVLKLVGLTQLIDLLPTIIDQISV